MNIHPTLKILSKKARASKDDIGMLSNHYPALPSDYYEIIQQATELEIGHTDWKVIRIWEPQGVFEMDEAYQIRKNIPGSIPIGDDEGGNLLLYFNGSNGFGIYKCDFSTLDADETEWICASISDLILKAIGIEKL